MMKAFEEIRILLKQDVYDKVTPARHAEFIADYPITDNIDVMCTKDVVEYSWHERNGSYAYLNVMIFRDGRIWVLYNPEGKIGAGIHLKFKIHSTEEDLFMLSTVQDDLGLGLEQLKVCNWIWEMYF